MTDAYPATLAHTLGLTSRDLADLGGFSDRFARDLMAGRRPFPADVRKALEGIADDLPAIEAWIMSDNAAKCGVIWIYASRDQLREQWPEIADIGIGPYRVAAMRAFEAMRADGRDVQLRFW